MVELPLQCGQCNAVAMVDPLGLDVRPISNTISAEGFECPNCENWEPVFFMTVSLQESFARLEKLKPGTNKFQKQFNKTLNKAKNLQSRIELRDGKSRNYDVASFRYMG
jgi:hypothetical protein